MLSDIKMCSSLLPPAVIVDVIIVHTIAGVTKAGVLTIRDPLTSL